MVMRSGKQNLSEKGTWLSKPFRLLAVLLVAFLVACVGRPNENPEIRI